MPARSAVLSRPPGGVALDAPALAPCRPSFESLLTTYQPQVYRFLYRLCLGNRPDAEDLCQETFLRAYRAFDRLDGAAQYRPWLYKIAYNAFLNSRRRAPMVDLPEELPAREDDRDRQELVDAIGWFVRTLPPKQRAALMLRHIEGREYDEVAAVLDCSEDAARANVFQAVKKVRARFEKEYRAL